MGPCSDRSVDTDGVMIFFPFSTERDVGCEESSRRRPRLRRRLTTAGSARWDFVWCGDRAVRVPTFRHGTSAKCVPADPRVGLGARTLHPRASVADPYRGFLLRPGPPDRLVLYARWRKTPFQRMGGRRTSPGNDCQSGPRKSDPTSIAGASSYSVLCWRVSAGGSEPRIRPPMIERGNGVTPLH